MYASEKEYAVRLFSCNSFCVRFDTLYEELNKMYASEKEYAVRLFSCDSFCVQFDTLYDEFKKCMKRIKKQQSDYSVPVLFVFALTLSMMIWLCTVNNFISIFKI